MLLYTKQRYPYLNNHLTLNRHQTCKQKTKQPNFQPRNACSGNKRPILRRDTAAVMENAGRNIAQEVAKHSAKGKKVAVFCGLGGNGGDGFVAARHLYAQGFDVTIVLAGKCRDISHESALQNWLALQTLQGKIAVFEVSDSSAIPKIDADVVVDALLGTGTKGKLKAPILQMVDYINSLDRRLKSRLMYPQELILITAMFWEPQLKLI